MKICPWCEAGYPDELTQCPVHGGLLSEIRDLKPGMLVRNTYRILRKLNQGGMGQVYLAEHILLGEPQVLKFLSGDLSHDPDWTNRFLREVRTLRQIRHKNVVTAGNLEPAEDGTLFFSMEFVDGPDLMEFYRHSPKPFDVTLALFLIRGVAEGLGAAHAVGVVHRDIKPENILLAREGNSLVPKVADFGIVATKEVSRLTQGGTALLTPQFAAPEQWAGTPTADLDGRTDLYALGGVLFELLTGRCAFQADNYQAWAQLHMRAEPPAPSSLRPELRQWRGLDEFVQCLLAKDPAERPQDVAETLDLLDSIRSLGPANTVPGNWPPLKPAALEPPPAAPPRTPTPSGSAAVPVPPRVPALVPATAAAGPRSTADPRRPRARLTDEPMPVWEPAQSRPSVQPRTLIRAHESEPLKSSRTNRVRSWLIVLAALVALGFAARSVLLNQVNSSVLLDQHSGILAVAFSPDGLSLASASRDNTIQFWNVQDGRPLANINGSVTCLAFSPDGHSLASGMADYTINIWDASRAVALETMQGHTAPVSAVAFSPDGHTLASASWDKTVRLWDVASGRLLQTLAGRGDRLRSVAYSPDGRILASAGDDGAIRLWDPADGKLLRTLLGHTRPVNSIAFSPDGRMLASGSDDMTLKLWNVATGQPTRTFQGHTGAVLSVAFSPDGRMLASGSADTTVRVWDVAGGELLHTLTGHTAPVLSVAFSPLGYLLASGSADKSIRLWEVAGLRE